ncbi:uncharacterized protein LOC120776041 [Bactrocera tryoni]|uniref:uncharacterized protein LOC120776041 n=1 Tax=Bactrocera tryoni TaxID=59916 RepID=UPI001A98B213|nr:uncharacterized protein LOC120776041 [Bactrocera tryoni]
MLQGRDNGQNFATSGRAEFYTIVFDESPDLSGKAQISVVLRHVDFSSGEACIPDDFVSFLDAFGQLAEGTESEESEDEDGLMAYRTAGKNDRTDEELSLSGSAIGGIVLGDMKKMNPRMEKYAWIGTEYLCGHAVRYRSSQRNSEKSKK